MDTHLLLSVVAVQAQKREDEDDYRGQTSVFLKGSWILRTDGLFEGTRNCRAGFLQEYSDWRNAHGGDLFQRSPPVQPNEAS
jgi:hypothetical protein